MCGISGFSGFENNKELALKANKIQFHRGPDYQGLWNDEYISLSHQRLSIIDLSESANQPFEKREHIIVYNGELYNFHEIRKELRDKGVSFISNSDTEVVLESFLLFGEKCLDKFRGMFSFVIYNKNNGRLFGARDHFGIKPFFYYQGNDNRFAFASELKTIVKQKEIKKDLTLNMAALLSSVNYLWVPENYSMFKEIKKLPSGCFFTKEKFCPMSIKKYYQVSRKKIDLNESEIIEKFKHIFENSIKKHLVSDVEVCSFLSGGLDSSLISVMAQKYYGEKMKTFTIGTRKEDKKIEKMPDDEKYADQLIKKFGFDSEKIVISPKITDELPKAVAFLDEPIGDPAAINTYLICKQAREMGIKVLLSGMGADEILGGYRRHLATIYSQKYKKIPGFIRRQLIERFSDNAPVKLAGHGIKPVRWLKRFLDIAKKDGHEQYMRSYSYYDREDFHDMFSDNISNEIKELYDSHEYIFNIREGDLINKMCNTDISMFMNGLNLTYTDRASMAASVEVRVPFIDKEVVDFAMNIPGDLKIKNGVQKYLLKKVAENYLPNEIIYRPKASFGAPIRSWISGELSEMVNDMLSKDRIEKRNIFNYSFIKRLINEDKIGFKDNAYQIYQLLTLELWFKEYYE